MNLADQNTIQIMQQALGWAPYGVPTWGSAFGSLPQAQSMPRGTSMMPGGTFFEPRLHAPHHLAFGGNPLGQLAGLAVEHLGRTQGYTYMPPGVNPMSVMWGRAQEQQIERVGEIGRGFDEYRMGRVFEQAMRNVMSPANAAAYSNAVVGTGPVQFAMPFLSRFLPGGSAQDFALQMGITATAMRDYTHDRYLATGVQRGPFQMGLPGPESQRMVARLLDFFQPGPNFDFNRTRGLQLGEMGQIGRQLAGYGLLDTDVSQADLRDFAKEAETTVPAGGADLDRMRNMARTLNVGRQLQGWADIVRTMRELMADPNAPIPQIIENLQALTGGKMQQFTAGQLQRQVYQMQNLARVTGISQPMMREMTISGAETFRQLGLNPVVGGQVAQQAAAMTVASQVSVPGPFHGRFAPDEEYNIRFGTMARISASPAVRISVKAMQMLEGMDISTMTPDQRTAHTAALSKARGLEWNRENMGELQGMLAQLGVGGTRSWQNLMNPYGVQEELQRRPELLQVAWRGAMGEATEQLGVHALGYYRAMAGGAVPDVLAGQLQRAAVGFAGDQEQQMQRMMGLVGEAFANMPTGAPEEMRAFLQRQGANAAGLDVAALVTGLTNDPGFRGYIAGIRDPRTGGAVGNIPELTQLLSTSRYEAAQQLLGRQEVMTAGQTILSRTGVRNMGTSGFQRFVGALAGGERTVAGAMMEAFGFHPMDALTGQLTDVAAAQYADDKAALDAEMAKPESGRDKAKIESIRSRMADTATAMADVFAAVPGVEQTRFVQTLLEPLEAVRKSLDALSPSADTVPLFDVRRVGAAIGQWSATDVDFAARGMRSQAAERFRGVAGMLTFGAERMAALEEELQMAAHTGDTTRVADIEEEMGALGGMFGDYGEEAYQALSGARKNLARGAAFGIKPTFGDRMEAVKVYDAALKQFRKSGTKGDLTKLQSALRDLQRTGVLSEGDEIKPNKEFIADVALRAKVGDDASRGDLADAFLKDMENAASFSEEAGRMPAAGAIKESAITALQEQVGEIAPTSKYGELDYIVPEKRTDAAGLWAGREFKSRLAALRGTIFGTEFEALERYAKGGAIGFLREQLGSLMGDTPQTRAASREEAIRLDEKGILRLWDAVKNLKLDDEAGITAAKEAFEKGQDAIEKAKEDAGVTAKDDDDDKRSVKFTVKDKDGNPLEELTIEMELHEPERDREAAGFLNPMHGDQPIVFGVG